MTTSFHPLSLFWLKRLKPSFRKRSEQVLGLSIFLTLTLGLWILNSKFVYFASLAEQWPRSFLWKLAPLWLTFYTLQGISAWILWRRHSLSALKLEISLFLSQFLLQILWSSSLFFWEQYLLSLVFLLLQMMATLLCIIAFWKKEQMAAGFLLLPFIWEGFICCVNMVVCLLI